MRSFSEIDKHYDRHNEGICSICGCTTERWKWVCDACRDEAIQEQNLATDRAFITSARTQNAVLQNTDGTTQNKKNNRPIEDALQARIEELENAAVVWHKYPEEKPIDGRHLFWDSDGNAPHVLPHNDIVVRDNPGVFSTQTHWAYLPAPPKEESND